MKRFLGLLCVLLCLVSLCVGCTQDKEQQVLYLLGEGDTLQTARRADGDCTVGEFAITWNWLGCELRYRDLAGEQKKQLTVGQKKKIEMVAQPMNLVFEGYLTYEGNGFPAAWKERFADNDRKEKE